MNEAKPSNARHAVRLVITEDNRLGNCPRSILHPQGWRLMKIPDQVRKCVAYLYYKTEKQNLEPVGTVFFVGYELTRDIQGSRVFSSCWSYAITSRHVIERIRERGADATAHLAMNGKDGEKAWIEVPLSLWQFPSGPRSDVAVLDVDFKLSDYDHLLFPVRGFLASSEIAEWGIGPSDEIYFSGLFTARPGNPANIPIIRSGHIAAVPAGVIATKYSDINAYLVEARSIGGLSGSPVFYSMKWDWAALRHSHDYEPPNAGNGLFLLGYVEGHYDQNEAADKFNMGIALVVSADEITAALEYPGFSKMRAYLFEQLYEEQLRKIMPTDD